VSKPNSPFKQTGLKRLVIADNGAIIAFAGALRLQANPDAAQRDYAFNVRALVAGRIAQRLSPVPTTSIRRVTVYAGQNSTA
jgi:hypothetical protein